MEKTIIIEGRQVKFKSTAATMLRYKAQFGRDMLRDFSILQAAFRKTKKGIKLVDIDKLDMETIYNLIWVFAKTADNSIPDVIDWFDTFDTFPLINVLSELTDLLTSSLKVDRKNE